MSSPPTSSDPRRRLGWLGEQHAAAHFERLGYAVVARNFRTRHGEIDLVVADERTLVFVEVKTRHGGSPWDALHAGKQRQVRAMASHFLLDAGLRPPGARELRFDAVGVVLDAAERLVRLDHLEAAF